MGAAQHTYFRKTLYIFPAAGRKTLYIFSESESERLLFARATIGAHRQGPAVRCPCRFLIKKLIALSGGFSATIHDPALAEYN